MREKGLQEISRVLPDLDLRTVDDAGEFRILATLKPEAQKRTQDYSLQQNITTLRNRVNELGVAEPIIQQQGADRVVVQLPGVQDTAKAKDILGRTATLEVRMVDDEATNNPAAIQAAQAGKVPFGDEYYVERGGAPILVRRQVVLTGDRINDAQPGFDNQTGEPAVHINLDGAGARIFHQVTRENVGKRMAILLFEKGKGEVVTAPVIRSEIPGGRVQISGRMTTQEAHDVALLLRAGALGGRRIGVYYYDAAHDYESQFEALRLIEPYLTEDALLIVDDTDWKHVARAIRDYRASQPRAKLLIELAGKDRGQPWWWEGVQVLRWR